VKKVPLTDASKVCPCCNHCSAMPVMTQAEVELHNAETLMKFEEKVKEWEASAESSAVAGRYTCMFLSYFLSLIIVVVDDDDDDDVSKTMGICSMSLWGDLRVHMDIMHKHVFDILFYQTHTHVHTHYHTYTITYTHTHIHV
jgi:hypothetical protein